MSTHNLKNTVPRGSSGARTRGDVFSQLSNTGFPRVSGVVASGAGQVSQLQGSTQAFLQQVTDVNKQLGDLKTVQQGQIDTTKENTQALAQNTVTKSGGSSVLDTIGQGAASLLGGGSILSPILNGILSLFGGGSSPTVAPLTQFQLPRPLQFQGGIDGGTPGITGVDYGQNGQARPIAPTQTPAASQVTVHINAMDSQSFLDHSEDIARAVREAMLHSNSLNDIVADL